MADWTVSATVPRDDLAKLKDAALVEAGRIELAARTNALGKEELTEEELAGIGERARNAALAQMLQARAAVDSLLGAVGTSRLVSVELEGFLRGTEAIRVTVTEAGDSPPQFSKDALPDFTAAGEFRKTTTIRPLRIQGPFEVETRHGRVLCQDGWLAVDEQGFPYPIAADEFELIYEAVP
jgi:hypothetical protein